MKRIGVLVSILLILSVFSIILISAQTENTGVPAGDVEKIQGGAEKVQDYSGVNIDEGGVNTENITSKFPTWKSKAGQTVEKINAWLEKYGSWLKIVFGMVPEISWLFTINIILWIFFFVYLFINGDAIFSFLSSGTAKITGLVIFIILLILKVILKIAEFISSALFGDKWYWYVIRILVLIAIIVSTGVFMKSRRKAKEKQEKEKTKIAQKVVQKTAEGVIGEGI